MELKNNFYRIETEYLPTGGLFYPFDTVILFRSASINLIRYLSSFDDGDFEDSNIILNYILENVCKVIIGGKEVSPQKILNRLDRMYILLACKELTFPDVFSDIHFEYECSFCSNREKIELIKNYLTKIDFGKFERFYNGLSKSFIFNDGLKNELELFIPNLNSENIISKFKKENPEITETSFFRYVKYLIPYDIDTNFDLNKIFKKVRNLDIENLLFLILFSNYFDEQLLGGISFICSNCQTKSIRLFGDLKSLFTVDLNSLSNSFFSNTYGFYKNLSQDGGINSFLDILETLNENDIEKTMNLNILKTFQMDLDEVSNLEYTLVRHLRFDYSLFFDDNVPFYWLWNLYIRLKDEKEEEEKQHKTQQSESGNMNPDRMFNKAGSMMKGVISGLKVPKI